MRYLFLGTPSFAKLVLKQLIHAGIPPALVICNPDKPRGRKKEITSPPTKMVAEKNHIPVFQPETINIIEWQRKIKDIPLAIIAAYNKILPQEILGLFPNGVIGVHPSLLPKYRGASPIQSAILAGEVNTGVTLFLTDEKMDHGPIIASQKLQITDRVYIELEQKLAELGGVLLTETLPKFVHGEITPYEQNHAVATFTKKFTTDDAFIDPSDLERAQNNDPKLAHVLHNKIHAFNPEPGAWTNKNGKRLKLLRARVHDKKLVLIEIQWEGRMPTKLR